MGTVKTVKKKQKHKSKGNVRTITKQVKNDSFFNFFDPPPIPDDPDADVDPETQDLLTADFEIAITFVIGSSLEPCSFSQEKLLKKRTSMKRRKKTKKRKMIRILTPPKLNLVNRNASNNKR